MAVCQHRDVLMLSLCLQLPLEVCNALVLLLWVLSIPSGCDLKGRWPFKLRFRLLVRELLVERVVAGACWHIIFVLSHLEVFL